MRHNNTTSGYSKVKKKVAVILAVCILLVSGAGLLWHEQKRLSLQGTAPSTPEDLKVCYETNPVGLDILPTFSWKMNNESTIQTAYQIQVFKDGDDPQKEIVWDSGKVTSPVSVCIPYEGDELSPCTRYFYTVHTWDENDREVVSRGSDYFETGAIDGDSFFSDSEWISAPEYERTPLDNEKHFQCENDSCTIDFAIDLANTTAGIVFGDMDTIYDDCYFAAVNNGIPEAPILQIGRLYRGEVIPGTIAEMAIGQGTSDSNAPECDNPLYHFDISLDITGNQVVAKSSGAVAGSVSLQGDTVISETGMFKIRTDLPALLDSISVSSGQNAIYSENFESSDNSFSPAYLKIIDGYAWIKGGITLPGASLCPSPYLRKSFDLKNKEIKSARLYASALGIYSLSINGQKVTDNIFDPGESVYDKYVNYCTYDVTELLKANDNNAIGCILGHGWYDRAGSVWGSKLAFLGKLVVTYEDGQSDVIVTDDSWMASYGMIRNDDFFQGETYDGGLEDSFAGWDAPGFDDDGWSRALLTKEIDGLEGTIGRIHLEARENTPVQMIGEIAPVSVTEPVPGTYVYDFGQQLSGFCRLNAAGEKGSVAVIRYAEALNAEQLKNSDDEAGTVFTANLLRASNTDYYIFGGKGSETYTPTFTWRSFRYVQVTGISHADAVKEEALTAISICSVNQRAGEFTSGSDELGYMAEVVHRTGLCNSVEHPSDCPQRDERYGWTGDANFYAETGLYYDNEVLFLRNFEKAIVAHQEENGAYPDMAPMDGGGSGNPGWGDAGVNIPYLLYRMYGDTFTMGRYFDSMAAYGEYLLGESSDYIYPADKDGDYGDFSALNTVPEDMVHTAECYRVMSRLSDMAATLGREDDARHFAEYADCYMNAFRQTYIGADGVMDSWTQSSYSLALAYGLYPDELREAGADYLVTCVDAAGCIPATGYAATPCLLQALAENGYPGKAYDVLLSRDPKSWMGQILTYNLSAIPENMTVITAHDDGTYSINGSLNHESEGSFAAFIYQDILGIRMGADDRNIILHPYPDKRLGHAEGAFTGMYGRIESSWRYETDENGSEAVTYKFTVPPNTLASATVTSPSDGHTQTYDLTPGHYVYTLK